jgi:hypothetical protein
MNILVAQFWTKNLSYSEFTRAINAKYCREKGYTYYVETNDSKILKELNGRSHTWYKPKLLLEILDRVDVDYVLFLDADAIVCDDSYRIEEFIDDKYDCVVTQDHGPSVMNAGILLFKNSEWTKSFLQKWWDVSNQLQGPHGQPAGYYNNALWHDQTCFGHLYNSDSSNREKIKIIDNRILNGREFRDLYNKNFIFHAFAYGNVQNRTIDSAYYRIFDIEIPVEEDTKISELATIYPIDKNYEHNYYVRVYDGLLKQKKDISKVIEFNSQENYNAFKILKKYFKDSEIIGVFPYIPPTIEEDKEVKKYKCIQSDRAGLEEISNLEQGVDLIIDDGTHKMYDQQLSLYLFFKSLNSGGIFIIEDLHTSIECKMESKKIFNWGDINKKTTLETLKEFVDTGIYTSDYLNEEECNYLTENIKSCTIYDDRGNWSIAATLVKK